VHNGVIENYLSLRPNSRKGATSFAPKQTPRCSPT
jgi:hypothetical protein